MCIGLDPEVVGERQDIKWGTNQWPEQRSTLFWLLPRLSFLLTCTPVTPVAGAALPCAHVAPGSVGPPTMDQWTLIDLDPAAAWNGSLGHLPCF